jgi:hypothetical protein
MSEHCARCGYLVEYHDVARRCPGLKTGEWKDRDPVDRALWREILARDITARMRDGVDAAEAIAPLPPLVPARPPQGVHEFAGYRGKQAVGMGRRAVAAGMDVAPYYWKSGAGVDGCAVKGWRAGFAFVATWKRPPGRSWAGDVAYAWAPDERGFPIKMTHTSLLELIR